MNPKIIFALLAGFNFGIIFLNIPPALSLLMDLYGLSYTGASVLMSALLWTHALMQIPAGMLVDRLSIKMSIALGIGLMACGNLLPAMAASYDLAIAGRIEQRLSRAFVKVEKSHRVLVHLQSIDRCVVLRIARRVGDAHFVDRAAEEMSCELGPNPSPAAAASDHL